MLYANDLDAEIKPCNPNKYDELQKQLDGREDKAHYAYISAPCKKDSDLWNALRRYDNEQKKKARWGRMTVEEAILILPCVGKPEHTYSLQECEAVQMATEALVKQIPKKPYYGDEYDSIWICPNPNCRRGYDKDLEKHKYCPDCGQAIIWEEQK